MRRVLESYVLRLLDTEVAEGRLVGEVEDVRTGEVRIVSGAHELASVVWELHRRSHRNPPHEDLPWRSISDRSSDSRWRWPSG